MKAAAPMAKAEMIERSVRCLAFGLIGLLPVIALSLTILCMVEDLCGAVLVVIVILLVIGLPFSIHALAEHRRIKHGCGEMWNPAHRYLFWGGVCGRVGLSLFFVGFAVVAIIGANSHFLEHQF